MKVGTDAVLLGSWATTTAPQRILDIGTGTGILALMLAQRFPRATLHAIDIDENACDQAAENFSNSPFAKRLQVHHLPVQDFAVDEGFDLIVANPPWFEDSLKSPHAARNTARHNDSLSAVCLIQAMHRLLRHNGCCCVVLPHVDAADFCDLAKVQGLLCERRLLVYPTPGSDCKRQLLCLTATESDRVLVEQRLIVELSRHNYSPEFCSLAQDFLLKL